MSEALHSDEPPEVFTVLDAVDVELVAAFWVEALRYRRVDRLDQYVVLVPQEGNHGSVFLVQGVTEAKQVKNRMHLDLHVDDPDAEAERLEGNEFDIGQR